MPDEWDEIFDDGEAAKFLDSLTLPDMLEWACARTVELYLNVIVLELALKKLQQASQVDVLTRTQEKRCIHLQARLGGVADFIRGLYPNTDMGNKFKALANKSLL
jgi:hypothetical protein